VRLSGATSEEVSQVARSLAFMTNLVTTLVGRMDRVEQNQSRGGSTGTGERRTTATEGPMETPMGGTPEAAGLGYVDLERLDVQMGRMHLDAGEPTADRPLATMDRIFVGRGYPGSLLGPLAIPSGQIVLQGYPQGAVHEYAAGAFSKYASGALSKYASGVLFQYAAGVLFKYAARVFFKYATGIPTDGVPNGHGGERDGGEATQASKGTAGVPATGFVCVNGSWAPYYLVQGQMVIHDAGLYGINAGVPGGGQQMAFGNPELGTVPPPPPPPRPRSPVTPVRRPAAGNNATPGGTPVPPPPPTPLPAATGSSVGGGGSVQRWLESTPVDRLQIRTQVLAQRPAVDKYQRVEQRASMLLLDSLPEDLKAEAVSVRAVTVEAMVFLVHCSFQPGGSAEKAYLLHFLTSPDAGNTVDAAVASIRKWIRLLRRGKELQVVLPDPSLLCRGLDKLHAQVFAQNKHPSAAFRIASFKLDRQLDYKAKASDVEDYAQLGECYFGSSSYDMGDFSKFAALLYNHLFARIMATVPCPSELRGVRGPSTVSEEEKDHDGSGFRSATWAAWAPRLKEVIKSEVEVSLAGATLERVMKMDASFLEHLRRDHIPYRRDCRACLAGSFRGHIHRRVVAPDAWCLSLDVIGPARQGDDERLKKVKYGLIATLAVPDVLGKLLQPAEPSEDDDGGGVGPVVEEDDPLEGDEVGPEEDADEPLSAAEKRRSDKEEAKWEALVAKEKIEEVTMVEVPFFMPLGSKTAAEVLTATKEILLQVRRLGLVVKRVHTDCGREFVNKAFRALCADRGLVRTTTGGDNFRSNGRVEALVGRAKSAVRTLLSSSKMGPEAWAFAMRHYTARVQWSVVTQLGGRYPRLPPFGTKVFVKKRSWQMLKEEFVEKVAPARILCPSMDVARGFLVKTEDGSYLTTMVAVENVKETSGEFEVDAAPTVGAQPGKRHRIKGKTTMAIAKCEELCKLDPQQEEHLIQDEECAEVFLEAQDFSPEAMEELLGGLWLGEAMVTNRRGKTFDSGSKVSAHVAGMFRHGGVVGATNLARQRPALTKYLVMAMKAQLPPGTTFTTLALNFNTPMQCHCDTNNKPGEKAFLMGFGNYVGGALWCHENCASNEVTWKKVQGRWLPGRTHNVYHRAVPFEIDPSLCICRASASGPQEFYIGDPVPDELDSGENGVVSNLVLGDGGMESWLQEEWGAYGPPEVAQLKTVAEEQDVSYQIVGAEVPLEVGWDLFEAYLDGLRLALVQEEYAERDHLIRQSEDGDECQGPLAQWMSSRRALEEVLGLAKEVEDDPQCAGLRKAEATVDDEEAPLHTKTIPNEIVRREIEKWVPSMLSEYESLVRDNEAVEPFPPETLEQWKKEGKEFDLVPGKTVHTVKAFTGRLKSRAVICGNFLGQSFSKDQKYVPKMFLLGGVCRETIWRVKRALYGMVTSPRSWEVYRNKTMAQMRGKVPEGEVRFVPSEIDGSLWYVMVGGRRAGAIICYVDDLLIAGERNVASEAAQMVARTWKCTEPQWDDVSFNGFEIRRTDEGLLLSQDSYTKDLLARYKDLDGFEETPAPVQLNAEDFVIKADESTADFVRAAQTMAGELQWLAGRCRPEILYAVNLLSQAISKSPKEAVYRGGHLLRYLKRFPEAGILYKKEAQLTEDAQVSSAGIVIEGFCDASFAPNSGRSQQAIMIFVMGGLVAWTSSRQAFVTMSTAESELVGICELTTCMKSIEQLVAEVMIRTGAAANEVMKVICSDSQAALSVCRCAAGSWRTRHLRIRGNMIRELLEFPDWVAYHLDGRLMIADLGTKPLSSDRFAFLVDKMRVVRKSRIVTGADPVQVKKLLALLCLVSLVDGARGAGTGNGSVDPFDYGFFMICIVAVIAVWECVKGVFSRLWPGEHRGPASPQAETGSSRSATSEGVVDRREVDSPDDSSAASSGGLRQRSRLTGEKRPPTPPVPAPFEPLETVHGTYNDYSFKPTGKRDYWEWKEAEGVVIRWHPTPRTLMFVPGQTAAGPTQAQLSGDRVTYAIFANGETKKIVDNYRELHKPARPVADREWKGRTVLKLAPGAKGYTAQFLNA
ncbi:RE2, partial [Symbiodinium sp. CCMP2456]